MDKKLNYTQSKELIFSGNSCQIKVHRFLVYLLIKNLSTYSWPVCMGQGSWSYFTQSALFIIFIRQSNTAQPGNDKAVSSH